MVQAPVTQPVALGGNVRVPLPQVARPGGLGSLAVVWRKAAMRAKKGDKKRPSRAVQRTRRRRPVGDHTPVGLATAGGLAEIPAGVLGTVATWVA
jgi:hypothetical protein